MELIIKDAKGKTMTVALPWEEMKKELLAELPMSRTASLSEEDTAKFQEELGNLTEEIARFETPEYQQEIVQAWAAKLTPEGFVDLATALGYEAHLVEATVAEAAEAEAQEVAVKEPAAVAEGEATTEEPVIKPAIVFEDPGDPAYKWMEHLKCWVLQR